MHSLYEHILSRSNLSPEAFEKCLPHFQLRSYPKKHFLIEEGNRVDQQYYVLKGCLRTYLLDGDKEHTIQFAIENWWVSDYISYYTGAASQLRVECIEDVELLSIKKQTLEKLIAEIPALEHFFRLQLEGAFVSFQKRILGNLHKSAQERYDDFLKSYPNIGQRVKNYQIASYLGVTPESLSRIRKMKG